MTFFYFGLTILSVILKDIAVHFISATSQQQHSWCAVLPYLVGLGVFMDLPSDNLASCKPLLI